MDRWRHRRRLVYGTVLFAAGMVLIGAFDWSDRVVSSQLVIGGVSLITLILTGYVFASTFDDRWSNYRGPSDFASQDYRADGYGVADDPANRPLH
ncbi:MAG TPA: hypothetical protein VIG24_09050 [Acidimicrobiia bacterium]